jgi:hypothetical protein
MHAFSSELYLLEWVTVATGRSSSFSGSYLHSALIHIVLLLHTVLCKFGLQFIQSSFSSSSNRTKNRLCSRLPTCQGHRPPPDTVGRLTKNRRHYLPSFVPSARTGRSSGGSRGRKPTRASIFTPARITGYVSANLFLTLVFQHKASTFCTGQKSFTILASQSILFFRPANACSGSGRKDTQNSSEQGGHGYSRWHRRSTATDDGTTSLRS